MALPGPCVGLASGGNDCVAVGEDGAVFAWGYGGMLQLGTGREDDERSPVALTAARARGVLTDRAAVTLAVVDDADADAREAGGADGALREAGFACTVAQVACGGQHTAMLVHSA